MGGRDPDHAAETAVSPVHSLGASRLDLDAALQLVARLEDLVLERGAMQNLPIHGDQAQSS